MFKVVCYVLLSFLIIMTTNNFGKKSVVLGSSVKPSQACQFWSSMVIFNQPIKVNVTVEVRLQCIDVWLQSNNVQKFWQHYILLHFNPLLLNPAKSGLKSVVLESAVKLSQAWQFTFLSWFDRRCKNHCLLTRVVGTPFNRPVIGLRHIALNN